MAYSLKAHAESREEGKARQNKRKERLYLETELSNYTLRSVILKLRAPFSLFT